MAELRPFPFALLRTPLQSLQHAYRSNADHLPGLFDEGLYLSSPEFWQEFRKAEELPGNEKTERGLSKYWLRSCSRCTPYGTFAGCAMIDIVDTKTSLIIDDNHRHRRHVRLDMNYISNLVSSLIKIPAILDQIRFWVNNSLYDVSDSWRYAEYTLRDNIRHYHLSSIEKSDYLAALIERARHGATLAELQDLVMTSEAVEADEARSFILNLLDSQLLISELEPCVTGREPFALLIEQLSALEGIDELIRRLKSIYQLLRDPGEGVAYYQEVEKMIRDLGVAPEGSKNVLQVDLYMAMKNQTIGKPLIDSILLQAGELMTLSRPYVNAELERFKTRFLDRFDTEEVPLSVALDADIGVGYAGVSDDAAGSGELIDHLDVAGIQKDRSAESGKVSGSVLAKYQDFLKDRKLCIELTEEDLAKGKKEAVGLGFPNSMFLMGSLMKSRGQLNERQFLFDLTFLGGPSAANLFGRFTHGSGPLSQATREILEQEEKEYGDVIFAEIVHLPQARTGNVLVRPVLRKYEIPYVGRSGADPDRQLPIDDICISVADNKIILRSKRLGKRVLPRLTTAHNFAFDSLPVYKFLCDLQAQGMILPNIWDWGELDMMKHLPQVKYKNIIIKKARWKIEEADIHDLPREAGEHLSYFADFCRKWGIPVRVTYKESDNGLLIDFREKIGISLFLHYLRRHKTVLIEEMPFEENNCVVSDPAGNPYLNEVIIPVQVKPSGVRDGDTTLDGSRLPAKVRRKYPPCSEWLYFKVYCGSKTAEKLLKETLLPFVEEGLKKGLFEKFFFVRYKDEFSHLRIRLFNSIATRQVAVQQEFMQVLQPYMDNGLVARVVVDTYCREIERYGAGCMEEAEELFYHDSLAVLRFIALLDEGGSKYRLLFAMRGIVIFLDDFHFSTEEKLELFRQLQAGYFKEFGGHLPLQRQLNEKYRAYQPFLFSHMDSSQDAVNEVGEAAAIFQQRSEMSSGVIDRILAHIGGQKTGKEELKRLLASHIHLFINRLFIAQQRKYELVVYHFLEKYHSSKMAMERKPKSESRVK